MLIYYFKAGCLWSKARRNKNLASRHFHQHPVLVFTHHSLLPILIPSTCHFILSALLLLACQSTCRLYLHLTHYLSFAPALSCYQVSDHSLMGTGKHSWDNSPTGQWAIEASIRKNGTVIHGSLGFGFKIKGEKGNLSLFYSACPPSVTSMEIIKLEEMNSWFISSKPLMSNYFEKV